MRMKCFHFLIICKPAEPMTLLTDPQNPEACCLFSGLRTVSFSLSIPLEVEIPSLVGGREALKVTKRREN